MVSARCSVAKHFALTAPTETLALGAIFAAGVDVTFALSVFAGPTQIKMISVTDSSLTGMMAKKCVMHFDRLV